LAPKAEEAAVGAGAKDVAVESRGNNDIVTGILTRYVDNYGT
jgi:hypothetical protein